MEGRSLLGPVTVTEDGRRRVTEYPDEALPDCVTCPKPSLEPADWQVVAVFQSIMEDRDRNHYSGTLYGLRFEARAAAIRWFQEAGIVTDPDYVMRYLPVLDDVYCRIINDRIEAARPKPKN